MGCTNVEALNAGRIGLVDHGGRRLAARLKRILSRTFGYMVGLTYRSSRLWTYYMS